MLIWKHGEGLDLVKTYDIPIAEILGEYFWIQNNSCETLLTLWIEKLDNKRQEAITAVLDELDKMTRELQEDQVDDTLWNDGYPQIDHARRCMTLGSALREKRRLDKLYPPLKVLYTGYSFAKVVTMVNEFRALEKSVKNHVAYASDEDSWPVSEQEDSPKQRLKNKIDIILSDAEWLQLENFRDLEDQKDKLHSSLQMASFLVE
jgi:hypothetical protein